MNHSNCYLLIKLGVVVNGFKTVTLTTMCVQQCAVLWCPYPFKKETNCIRRTTCSNP